MSITEFLFWFVRGIVVVAGIIPSLIKIVEGSRDEDDRKRNAGIATIAICALVIIASFPLANYVEDMANNTSNVTIDTSHP